MSRRADDDASSLLASSRTWPRHQLHQRRLQLGQRRRFPLAFLVPINHSLVAIAGLLALGLV